MNVSFNPVDLQVLNLSSNAFSSIDEKSFRVSSSQGALVLIENNRGSITCPWPVITSNVLFLHDLCSPDLTLLKFFGIACCSSLGLWALLYVVLRELKKNSKGKVRSFRGYAASASTVAQLGLVTLLRNLVSQALKYYDVYADVTMYKDMLSFLHSDKAKAEQTCGIQSQSSLMMNLLPPHGNLTLDVVNDLKLLVNDRILNKALLTNVSRDFIGSVLKVSDIFQNPSIQKELSSFANQTCVTNKCDYSFDSFTCSPPSRYEHATFLNLVIISVGIVIAKEFIMCLPTLYLFPLSKNKRFPCPSSLPSICFRFSLFSSNLFHEGKRLV